MAHYSTKTMLENKIFMAELEEFPIFCFLKEFGNA
jgi:hypothetical protein